jgi:L-alanine-DL-glutamate epimerase-like enolase superfamily enzyme
LRAELRETTLALDAPLRTSYGELRERPLLLLEIEGGGSGEAAPLEPYDGVSLERCRAALEAHLRVLRSAGADVPGAALMERCAAADPLPQALAAVDLALWDRAGRREGRPVCALLAGDPLDRVRVNATIGALDRAGAAAAAAAAAARGFSCVKVKVGAGDDAGRVAAVRAACGPDVELRLDANGVWDVDAAVRAIEALSPAGLELVEEPVHGVEALRAVRERVPVRVAMDETAAQPGALTAAVADAACLKVSRCGGISALLAQAALVRASGADVYVSSTFDGPLGLAAALHCAAALRCAPACGLATLESRFPAVDGAISVPSEPGLGAR